LSSKIQKTDAIVSALLVWFETKARDLPWRRTRDPYAIWVSEIMLQQMAGRLKRIWRWTTMARQVEN
jgi:adenine-specific DNA glycosylase